MTYIGCITRNGPKVFWLAEMCITADGALMLVDQFQECHMIPESEGAQRFFDRVHEAIADGGDATDGGIVEVGIVEVGRTYYIGEDCE